MHMRNGNHEERNIPMPIRPIVTGRMKSLTLLILFASTALTNTSHAEHPYVIVREPTDVIHGTYALEIDSPKLTVREWILFVAAAPELPGQSQVRTTLQPAGVKYIELSDRRRELLRAQIPARTAAQKHHLSAKIEWRAQLYRRSLARRRPGGNAPPPLELSAEKRKALLAESKLVDFTADPLGAWIDKHALHRKSGEDALDFGRRVFLQIARSFEYDYASEMDRRASHVCEAGKSDCGGMCTLFIAVMRRHGIPARSLYGRWAKSAKIDETLNGVRYRQEHVKAEFFVDGLGWVPVDLSSAVLHDRSPEGLRYFANDPGDFLTVHVDGDLKVDTIHFGEEDLSFLQSFAYYITGTGKFEDITWDATWNVDKR